MLQFDRSCWGCKKHAGAAAVAIPLFVILSLLASITASYAQDSEALATVIDVAAVTPPPAATAAAAMAADTAPSANLQSMLDKINAYRILHGAQRLQWSTAVYSRAVSWASQCIFGLNPNSEDGQLVYGTTDTSNVTSALLNAVGSWYGNKKYYNYSKPGFSIQAGTFTALVWRATTLTGCVAQVCNGNLQNWGDNTAGTLVVCSLSPLGNIDTADEFRKNVLPEGSDIPTDPEEASPSPEPQVSPSPSPSPATYKTALAAGKSLDAGSRGCLESADSRYRTCLKSNGNLVLFRVQGNVVLWQSRTARSGGKPYKLTMQPDGDLTLTTKNRVVFWKSGSAGKGLAPRYKAQVLNTGKLVIKDTKGLIIWSKP